MPISVPNPYSGEDDQTCSVSFAAQQQMASGVSSPQTEADYNKSKLLGEWGVIMGKLANGQIPNGTKLMSFNNPTAGSRGYFFVKNGQLYKKNYFADGHNVEKPGYGANAELIIKNPNLHASIPQAVAPNPKPEPVVVAYKDPGFEGTPAMKEKLTDGQVIATKADGYISWSAKDQLFQVFDKDASGYGYVQTDASKALYIVMDDETVWYKPDGKASTPKAEPKVEQPKTGAPPPTTFIAAPTPAAPVNAGSTSVGSMSHEDVAALFVKIKDDLAKEKGLNIKGANLALDIEVYKAIGDAIGYQPYEVKAKIDAYKAAGNKLSALKKKVLAGTKKVPVLDKEPPKPSAPAPSPKPPSPEVSVSAASGPVPKKEALAKLQAVGSGDNGYVDGGTTALGLLSGDGINVNKKASEFSSAIGPDEVKDLKSLVAKYGTEEMVDPGTPVYTKQTWLVQSIVKKYINNPGDGAAVAVRIDGKLVVFDGNHRAAAGKLTNTPVKMMVLDLDKPPKSIGPDPKPNGVPTVATAKVAQEVKVEVKKVAEAEPGKVYSDEDVASAYIIAKDKIVADSNGKWTLYSKSDEMDLEIAIQVGLKTGLNPTQQKVAIANYLATGKKLSQLKKALAKQGAFTPQADTLKKSGTAKTLDDKAKDVSAKADAGYTPTPTPAAGTPPVDTGKPMPKAAAKSAEAAGDISGISGPAKSLVYSTFKGQGGLAYLSATNEQTYEALVKTQAAMKSGANQDLTLLQLLRVIDEEGAKKFKAENGKLFEKKTATWLTTPEAASYIKKKEKELAEQAEKAAKQAKLKAEAEEAAKKLMANQPPLPADSKQYEPWELEKARRISKTWLDAKPWTDKERRDLKHYTGSAYTQMNGYLRGLNSSIDSRSKSAITGAQEGMRPTTEPILVNRGTGLNQFQSIGVGRGDATAVWGITGKTFKDEGFLSTSAGGRAAFGGEAVLEIECPVGTPMAYVAPISNYPSENEMLLQAGMEYKVLNVRKVNNTFVVRVRVVNWPGKVN